MDTKTKRKISSKVRSVMRYPWAVTLIPLGLAMGVGGLIQHAIRTVLPKKD